MILRHATECIGTDGVDGLRGHILTLTALIAAAPDIARAYLDAKEGWDGATKVGIEYQETIARLTAERDRLRKMVKDAYNAGFSEGMREYTSANGGTPWHDSKFRAALGKEG